MLFTILIFAIAIGVNIGSALLWALCLRLGLRWARVTDVTIATIVAVTAIVFAVQLPLSAVSLFTLGLPGPLPVVFSAVVMFVSALIVPCVVIKLFTKASALRSFQAWLPTLLSAAATFAFVTFILRPFLYETFIVPTNAMAPTIVGKRWEGTCPQCGQKCYCSARDQRFAAEDEPRFMICENFHTTEMPVTDRTVHQGDHIVAAKFLMPRRWDIIVFKNPMDPTVLHIQRLVGLPGEKIEIRDGSVWANGEKLTLPESLSGLEYTTDLPDHPGPVWGSPDKPALLGDDEYFVLGDFSAQSLDSRMWYGNIPGRNPYALPRSYIKGVVVSTYWPLERQRAHR